MTQEVIDIGTAPNDGLGDPLRTAFAKTNNNFSQLFSTSGITGLANGTSNIRIPVANGNVVISSAGTSNVLTITGTGVNVAGTLNSSGLATLSNLSVTGAVISTGTIQSLADLTAVNVAASANITGAYLFGDGGYLSNITAVSNLSVSVIANGSTSIGIPGSGGNAVISVNGVADVAVFTGFGQFVTGFIEVSGVANVAGNIRGDNYNTTGIVTATGNITGGNLLTGGVVSATSNITSTTNVTGGNLITGGLVSAAANITGGNLATSGTVSATGNVTGGNVLTGGLASTTGNVTGGNVLTGGLASATGNVTGGNVLTGGLVSATGNVTGNYILGNGALLTGVITSVANINNGTSNVTVVSSGGNVSVGVGGTSNVAVFATTGEYVTGVVSASGNVIGGNILTTGLFSATGNVLGNVFTVNLGNTTTAIINGGGNAVGNIGSSSNYFNQVFAQATTALYADLAEIYSADAEYSPGTVVSFGGGQEVTRSTVDGDNRVAGVISENPSYLMNSGLEAEYRAAVALTGRVPTLVIGPVAKGDMMISAGNGWARASATPAMGTVIGKALKNFDGDSGIIEIVVGRL